MFAIYIIIGIFVTAVLYKVFKIKNANEFDTCYFILLMVTTSICSILFSEGNFIAVLKRVGLTGITSSIVAYVIFYILDKTNFYFTFEVEGYIWIGVYGLIRISIYLIISSILGIILWKLKLLLMRLMAK